ncbi:MAG TPA: vanadium-dependent haloperoxidase [Pyrinomonadaceae bacterium]|nr:vanadium-dependent haloperoxidase [Pyrinomonadaceae bacterium]
MRVKTLCGSLAITAGLVVVLLGVTAYSAVSEACGVGGAARQGLSAGRAAVAARSLNAVPPVQAGDAVTEWNQHAVGLSLSSPPAIPAALSPVQQTRVMAIVQVAVHDAVNGITGEYATYLSPGPAPANASPEAAAVAAAHHALRNLFAGQAAALDASFSDSLAARGLSEHDPGVEYGRAAAAAILAARADDLSAQAQYDYIVPGAGAPGVWVRLNNAPALLPGWGSVTPFVLKSGSQFRPDPPPALDSEQYARDYNEVKSVGALNSTTRTEEQRQIALFWRASPTAIWNPVLRQVAAARPLDLSAKARAYALFYLAASDASVACWEAKYYYNYWRPQLAIRGGDADGNDLTAGDAGWQPLLPTPPHPEYPSGHASNSGAMAAALGLLFGDDPGVQIEVTLSGITRRWATYDEAIAEVIDARVYSGIHFRTANEAGARAGRQVAHFVSTHALRRCPKGKGRCSSDRPSDSAPPSGRGSHTQKPAK